MGYRSGVDILKLLEYETRRGNGRHRRVVQRVREQVVAGHGLAYALQQVDPYFPPLLCQMVAAGETAGGLDKIFRHMADYYRDLRTARKKFWSQLTWPLIQLVMALGVVSLVIVMQGLLSDPSSEFELDALGFGWKGVDGLMKFWTIVGCVAAVILAIAAILWNNAFNIQAWLMPILLRTPILGAAIRHGALARMSMTLAMLLNAGVDALRSVREAFLSTGNPYYRRGMPVALEAIQQGQSLGTAFEKAGVFPEEFIEGTEVGELSGNETESLEYLATEYDERAKSSMSTLATTLSTLVWIAIASFIIFLIIRMFSQYVGLLQKVLPK